MCSPKPGSASRRRDCACAHDTIDHNEERTVTGLHAVAGIGPGLAAELGAAGVRDLETLRDLGAVEAARRVGELGFRDAAAVAGVLQEVLGTRDPTGLGVLGIDNVLFTVGDLDAALAHYAERLGLPVAFRVSDPPLALLRLGAEPPGLLLREDAGLPSAPPRPGAARLWLEVPDATVAAASLRAAGVAPLAEPFRVATGLVVEVADPWGNVVGLTDYSAAPHRGRAVARPE